METRPARGRYIILNLLLTLAICIFKLDTTLAQSTCNNVLHNAIVVDYSSSYSDDFMPENLIDGNERRSWSSSETDDQPFVVFNLGERFEVDRLQFNGYFQANNMAYQGDSIREFQLEGFVDGEWVVVFQGESPLQDRLIEYHLSSSIVADQVKIVFQSNHGGTAFEAAELILCGQRATGTSTDNTGGKENSINEPLLVAHGEGFAQGGHDTYTFEGRANQIITVEIHSDFNSTLELYDTNDEQIAYNNDGRARPNSFDAVLRGVQLPIEGTYTVVVGSNAHESGGPYNIVITEGVSGETVGSLVFGQSSQGELAQGEADNWTFRGQANQVVTVEMRGRFGGSMGSFLLLYDPDFNYVAGGGRDSTGTNTSIIRGVQLPIEGIYTVVAQTYQSNSLGGLYSLSLTEGVSGETVGTLAFGQSSQGELVQDWADSWTFFGQANQVVTIEMNSNFDNELKLYDPRFNRLSDSGGRREGDNYSATINQMILPSTGVYTVIVRGRRFEGGMYSLIVNN